MQTIYIEKCTVKSHWYSELVGGCVPFVGVDEQGNYHSIDEQGNPQIVQSEDSKVGDLDVGILLDSHCDDECDVCPSFMGMTKTRYKDYDYLRWECLDDECTDMSDRHEYHTEGYLKTYCAGGELYVEKNINDIRDACRIELDVACQVLELGIRKGVLQVKDAGGHTVVNTQVISELG
jgi:hypothetical protein